MLTTNTSSFLLHWVMGNGAGDREYCHFWAYKIFVEYLSPCGVCSRHCLIPIP